MTKKPPPPPRPTIPPGEMPTEDLPHRIDRLVEHAQGKRYHPLPNPFEDPVGQYVHEDPVIRTDDLVEKSGHVVLSADEHHALIERRDEAARARTEVQAVANVLDRVAAMLKSYATILRNLFG